MDEFKQTCRKGAGRANGCLRQLTGSPAAEELQKPFGLVPTCWDGFRGECRSPIWLCQIGKNLYLDRQRGPPALNGAGDFCRPLALLPLLRQLPADCRQDGVRPGDPVVGKQLHTEAADHCRGQPPLVDAGNRSRLAFLPVRPSTGLPILRSQASDAILRA